MTPEQREIRVVESARVPWDGLLLAWAAMVPLAACAAWGWFGGGDAPELARGAARLWGVALLLFFSGVRRGLSFRTEGGPRASQVVGFAALFVGGLVALVLPPSPALVLIAAAFALLAVVDPWAARRGEAPLYFRRLRPWQMGFAVVATGLCWAAR